MLRCISHKQQSFDWIPLSHCHYWQLFDKSSDAKVDARTAPIPSWVRSSTCSGSRKAGIEVFQVWESVIILTFFPEVGLFQGSSM